MGYQLQYISSTNGAFDCTLAANATSTSVIEQKFLSTSYAPYSIYFGVDFADVKLNDYTGDRTLFWYPAGIITTSSYWTLNEEHTVSVSASEYKWNGVKIYDTTGIPAIPSTPRFRTAVKGHINYFKITDNNNDVVNLVAWDEDGTLGLKDLVSGNFYTPATGTWTAGPRAHVFEPSKSSLTFPASGGSLTFDVEAETTWTASTPTFVTLSPSTGGTGTTTVTATCPSYTGTTKREETITFTDNDSYTFDVKIRQRALTNGISNLYLGENQIPTANAIYLGDAGVNTIYLGEEIVYSSGPFVGLKASPKTLALNNLNTTANITIRSSENWTITDNSSGGHYVLYNWTSNCPSFTATYDGSIDYLVPANPVGNGTDSILEEWDSSNSMSKQDFIDLCASHGITLDGMNCDSSGYRIELRPVAGGSKWLSYSQTSGGSGKTVVTVTASTTQAERTATITVTSANYSATVGVTQKTVYYKDLYVTGAAKIVTDFNPYTFYTQNNNYMKIVLCHDYNGSGGSNKYLFATQTVWFSFENYGSGCYFSFGNNVSVINNNGLPSIRTTNGVANPIELVFTGNSVTATQGENTQTNTYTGNIPNDNLVFYNTSNSVNYQGHLYGFAVYGQNDVLAHWYVGYDDGVNVGIEDLVTGNKFQPNGSNYTIQCSDL